MKSGKNIDQIIAGIVTDIALSFPVAYILSIAFFNGKNKIAFCNWEMISNKEKFRYHFLGNIDVSTGATIELQTIEVNAIDMEGRNIVLISPFAQDLGN